MSATSAYAAARAEALAGQDADERPYAADKDALAAYQAGRRAGKLDYDRLYDEGFRNGLAQDLGSDLKATMATIQDLAAKVGFFDAANERIRWYHEGRGAGRIHGMLDFAAVPTGKPGSETFLRDYMAGYNAGLHEAASPIVTTATGTHHV